MWRRKEVATPADSVAADALDALAIEGTRVALVPPAPDAGVLELPLPALLVDKLPLFLYGFQTLMYTKRPEASLDPVRRATKFLIASRCGHSFDKWPGIFHVKQRPEAAAWADSTATTTLES